MSQSSAPPRVVLEARARLGEGPVWDERTQSLFWVDIYNHRVHQYFPDRGAGRVFDVGDVVGCVALTRADALLVALRHRIARLDLVSGRLDVLATLEDADATCRFNDGKCDPQGRFWVGTASREPGRAALYRFDADGSLRVMETGLTISNGLGWSPDGGTFYLTDSPARTIYAYDFDAARGEIRNRRAFAELAGADSVPDGLAVDAEGCLWSAQWDGGCVLRLGADGRERQRLELPVVRPTSCAFGGAELRDLYITSASVALSEEQLEQSFHSGDLFCVRLEVAGLPPHRFAGRV